MSLICAGAVVIDGQVCRPGWLQTSGRRILACGAGAPPGRADADFPDSIVVPGFIDMHVHGGGGASYTEAHGIAGAAAFHLQHGTTTTLASLVRRSSNRLGRALSRASTWRGPG
jgi:N-acetylglucosamine-6-phosphate deacetylase